MPRLRLTALLALFVSSPFAATGCGDDHGASTAGSDRLERLIQVETVRALMTDTGVPKPAADDPRVKAALDKVDVSCGETGTDRYECELGLGDWSQVCSIATNQAVTRIRWQRCGTDEAPEVTEEYVDCGDFGATATGADPLGDVTYNTAPAEPVVRSEGAISDLQQVRVAVSDDEICVTFDFADTVRTPMSVNFWAYPEESGVQRFSLYGALDRDAPATIGDGNGRDLSGRIGARGRSVSVVIARDDIADTYDEALDGPFRFAAHVGHRVRGPRERGEYYVDELNGEPTYP